MALCCLLWYWLGFYPKLQLTTTVSHKSTNNQIIETTFTLCSLPTSPKLTYGRASSSQVIYLLVFSICCSLPHFGTIGAFPFGRLTCVLSRCQLALDLSVRGTGHLYPPFALSGRLLCGWCCFFILMKLLLRWNFHPTFVATFSPFVADRRATARTTATLSHSASRQKITAI